MIKNILTDIVQEKYISDIIINYKNDMELFENHSLYLYDEYIYIFKCYHFIFDYLKINMIDLNSILIKKFENTICFSFIQNNNNLKFFCNIYFDINDTFDNICPLCNTKFDIFNYNLFNKTTSFKDFNSWFNNIKICKLDSCNQHFFNHFSNFNHDFSLKFYQRNFQYSFISDTSKILNNDLKIHIYSEC